MAIHVAILWKQYIDLILAGTKTIESRLTMRPLAPFHTIKPGEMIYFKQSSGPYRARAIAEDVKFFDDLTPEKIAALQKLFNGGVCGPEAYWQQKKISHCATFITLANVQPTNLGPVMEPSSGLAWFTLPNRTPLKAIERFEEKVSQTKANLIFEIALSAGALRNQYVKIPREIHAFPAECYGGKTIASRGKPLTLDLPNGKSVQTDLTPACMFRWRGWREFFQSHHSSSPMRIEFEQIQLLRYRVTILQPRA